MLHRAHLWPARHTDEWRLLSPHGQRISRFVVVDPGETVIGAGFVHPRRSAREAFKAQQLAELGEERAAHWQRRL